MLLQSLARLMNQSSIVSTIYLQLGGLTGTQIQVLLHPSPCCPF
jgi:hypothetical protein